MSWVLVTGGARRLGAEVCRAVARRGHDVAVHYRYSEDAARQVAEECRSTGAHSEVIQGDFSSAETTEDFLQRYRERHPSTQHLINNVGNFCDASLIGVSTESLLALFQVNVHVPLLLARGLADSVAALRGSIVNIGVSGLASRAIACYGSAYMVTKQSLWAWTRALALELAPRQVRVNMVSPGQLDISADYSPLDHSYLPMDRPGTAMEVARVVAFLLDDTTSYVTGQNIEVAGGSRL